ncbi:MAG: hypothetical protein AB1500_10425 [Bacillota bacterium]
MKHTFLFQEAVWTAKGIYIDENGNTVPVEGRTEITHAADLWINDGYLRLSGAGAVEFRNRYEIVPPSGDRDFTSWKSFNPALGTLTGNFTFVDDPIISSCVSEDGGYTSVEYLLKVSDAAYRGRGVLYKGKHKLSSWAVELSREE